MLELYNAPHSTCSQKVRVVLAEKQLDWADHRLAMAKNEHLTPDYLAINPNGVVPTLLHDDEIILDSSVICEYLDEVFPDVPLTPSNAVDRAKMRAWMRYLEEVPTVAIRAPSFNSAFIQRWQHLSDDEFETGQADIRPLRKHFYRQMGNKGFSQEAIDASLEKLDQALQRMEDALENGPWLLGEQFTIADIIMLPTIDRMDDLGLSAMWSAKPNVEKWFDRIRARPSYKVAFYSGSRVSEISALNPIHSEQFKIGAKA